ncbi:hypothetical protein PAECIP111891_04243 [Paenibacillus allorhizoplanae]|uniref:Uncharacterized protein n=2 Tax=Paenibacillus allorhizoplanae TaxID=2905648 RepID=A0ABN8GQC1_9BACL|nr:hypothetical protein PAECIP111891_04243 [Paenibacillus allorhizoplanae]
MLHLIELQRQAARKNLTKESVIEQFTLLIDDADTTTLEFISCQLTLLQSFMGSGGKDESKN